MSQARVRKIPPLAQAAPEDRTVCLDVTAKSSQGLGRFFAPSWELVMAYKDGLITPAAYAERYRRVYEAALASGIVRRLLEAAARHEELVLLCYCRDGMFCHTLLLRDWLKIEIERGRPSGKL